MLAKDRISKIVEKWYILEPLFFSVWSMHRVEPTSHIKTIKVQNGHIEYNPLFIDALTEKELYSVLSFEAMRIILKHPYCRKKPIAHISYLASNITVQEYIKTEGIGFKDAFEFFGTREYDRKHFEFYYEKIVEEAQKNEDKSNENTEEQGNNQDKEKDDNTQTAENDNKQENDDKSDSQYSLDSYVDEENVGYENAEEWGKSEYHSQLINDKIKEAEIANSWGTITGSIREKILATLKPKVNYRTILKSFRASVLSSKRRLTRMKPSRRYGFLYMGSRHDFSTKLLFAVDVSGSVDNFALRNAFSILNNFFKYGIEEISVICFDTEIKGKKMDWKKAKKEINICGRGGTNFNSVIEYIDKDRSYDGVIIFTDGYAPAPKVPKNMKTKILWLFNNEENYNACKKSLTKIGKVAFIKET